MESGCGAVLSQLFFAEFLDQLQDGFGHACHEDSLLNHRSTLGQTLRSEDDCPVPRC
ncbi:MAG: hypothetical protein NTU62_17255 [Spirochaetes bacterium]|nr:hypothetical protein [Spirochaetota bacterium]